MWGYGHNLKKCRIRIMIFFFYGQRKWSRPFICAFAPIDLCLPCVKTVSFSSLSNCLCCVSLTLRCPLISTLRQDLSFSAFLTTLQSTASPHMVFSLPYLFSAFFPSPRCSSPPLPPPLTLTHSPLSAIAGAHTASENAGLSSSHHIHRAFVVN